MSAIESLPVAAESPAGYDRQAFFYDSGATRMSVLEQESRTPVTKDAGGNVVVGEWVSPWDGVTHTDANQVEVDHTVALAEAWASGASAWDAAKRRAFANDTASPEVLNAVTTLLNQQKGDSDPAEWAPPLAGSRCEYARQWTSVKKKYGFSVDAAEREALVALARECPPAGASTSSSGSPAPTPSAATSLAQTGGASTKSVVAVIAFAAGGAVLAARMAKRANG
ncbi:HNH endonuclease family protein [Streptomyces sp. NPDC001774]